VNVTAERVIGVVDFIGIDKNGAPFARLIPLCEVTDGEWRTIPSGEFPKEDRVFWPVAREAVDRGLFVFRPETNHTGQRDEFRAMDAEPATEVVDVRALGTPEKVRVALASGALKLAGVSSAKVLLWCNETEVVGPVKFRFEGSGQPKLDVANKDRIPRYAAGALNIRSVAAARTKRFILAGALPAPSGYVDWDDDRLVVRRAVAWVVDRAKRSGQPPALVKRQIDDLAEAIAAAAADCDAGLERYRLERARRLFAEANAAEQFALDAAEEISRHPDVATALDVIREKVRADARDTLAAQLRAEGEAMQTAQREKAKVQAELANLHARVDAAKSAVAAQVRDVEAEVERRIAEVLKRPATLLADVALLRAAFSSPASASQHRAPPMGSTEVIEWPPSRRITEVLELRRALTSAFKASGVASSSAMRIHAAIAAGLVPIVSGPRALSALEAYGRVVCGARTAIVHATPTLLDPSELFGKVDPGTQRFVAHQAGLLSFFEAARRQQGLALVTVEGMNRGPAESYLLPLLECVSAGASIRLPAVAGEGNTAAVETPANLRFAATVVDGATSLPVARDLWAHAVLIEVEPCAKQAGAAGEASEVLFDSELLRLGSPPQALVDELVDAVPDGGQYREAAQRFAAALASTGRDEARIKSAVIQSLLLPIVSALEDEEERSDAIAALERLQPAGDGGGQLAATARRIRRRIA
jgi:hypothetical protein